MVAPRRLELPSQDSEPCMIGHYTTELVVVIHVLTTYILVLVTVITECKETFLALVFCYYKAVVAQDIILVWMVRHVYHVSGNLGGT